VSGVGGQMLPVVGHQCRNEPQACAQCSGRAPYRPSSSRGIPGQPRPVRSPAATRRDRARSDCALHHCYLTVRRAVVGGGEVVDAVRLACARNLRAADEGHELDGREKVALRDMLADLTHEGNRGFGRAGRSSDSRARLACQGKPSNLLAAPSRPIVRPMARCGFRSRSQRRGRSGFYRIPYSSDRPERPDTSDRDYRYRSFLILSSSCRVGGPGVAGARIPSRTHSAGNPFPREGQDGNPVAIRARWESRTSG
jgi:hypothetical protein